MAVKKKRENRKERWKRFREEFRKFIARGNVMDLAVGVIIGGAFGKIVTSLVNDIMMPLVALAMGGHTLAGLSVVLNGVPKYVTDSTTGAQVINPEAVLWNYGNFIQTILDFLIIALVVFCFIKAMNRVKTTGETVIDRLEKLSERLEKKPETDAPDSEKGADGAEGADAQLQSASAPQQTEGAPVPPPASDAAPAGDPKGQATGSPESETSARLLAEIRDLLKDLTAERKEDSDAEHRQA